MDVAARDAAVVQHVLWGEAARWVGAPSAAARTAGGGAALPPAQVPSDAHALRLSADLLRAPTADELRLLGKVAASNGRGQQQSLDPGSVEFKF